MLARLPSRSAIGRAEQQFCNGDFRNKALHQTNCGKLLIQPVLSPQEMDVNI